MTEQPKRNDNLAELADVVAWLQHTFDLDVALMRCPESFPALLTAARDAIDQRPDDKEEVPG